MATLWLRFFIGGACVSLFAVAGDTFRPKSFAGLFGAAPSISLAGLGLIWAHEGAGGAMIQARSMIIGAVAMILYSASCALWVRRTRLAPWLIAGILWAEWSGAAWLLYRACLK